MSYNTQGVHNKVDFLQQLTTSHNIDLICLQETWLTNSQDLKLLKTVARFCQEAPTIIKNGRRAFGGLIIVANPKTAAKCNVIKCEKTFIHVTLGAVNILNCYIPPSAPDTDLEQIFEYASQLPGRTILCGDFNARLGHIANDSTIDKRGELCLEILTDNNLQLEAPINGRWTTTSINGRGIPDHIFTNGTAIEDYKILKTSLSDHYPLLFKVKSGIAAEANFERWNIKLLADADTREYFKEVMERNALKLPKDLELLPVHEQWNYIKMTVADTARETIGRKTFSKTHVKSVENEATLQILEELEQLDLILADMDNVKSTTWKTISNRRNTLIKEYTEIHRKLVIYQYQKTMGDISLKQNRQSLIKKLACKVNNTLNGTKSLDPKRMRNHEDHFKQTFGKEPRSKKVMTLQYHVPEERLTKEDIMDAISRTSMGKAAGADELFSEFWHYGKNILAPYLVHLFNKILETGVIPEDWKRTLVCPIYKKGDSALASNYRPIAITSSCRRIFEKCVFQKFIIQHVAKLADSQSGFRPQRNCQQQIFALHEAMANSKCQVVFLDQAAAYDSVNRDLLWLKLRVQFDVPDTTISVLQVLFDDNFSTLVIKNTSSAPINNKSGLLQGSALSPILFNFFNNDLLTSLANQKGVRINTTKITNLAFADDIAVVAENSSELQAAVKIARFVILVVLILTPFWFARLVSKSLLKKLKRIGDSAEPCRSPLLLLIGAELVFLITSVEKLSSNNTCSTEIVVSGTSNCTLSFNHNKSLFTESYAAAWSRKTTWHLEFAIAS